MAESSEQKKVPIRFFLMPFWRSSTGDEHRCTEHATPAAFYEYYEPRLRHLNTDEERDAVLPSITRKIDVEDLPLQRPQDDKMDDPKNPHYLVTYDCFNHLHDIIDSYSSKDIQNVADRLPNGNFDLRDSKAKAWYENRIRLRSDESKMWSYEHVQRLVGEGAVAVYWIGKDDGRTGDGTEHGDTVKSEQDESVKIESVEVKMETAD